MYPYNQYPYMSQQKPTENMNWIFVNDVDKVEQVNVMAGQKAWVMVQNEPVFALRVADNMGLVSTEYYKFEKYNPRQVLQEVEKNYVTKDEMNMAIEKAIREMKDYEQSIISKSTSELSEASRTVAKYTDDN